MDRDFATNQIQQFSEKKRMPDTLTASNGRPLEDLTTSMTAGKRGPIVLKDFSLMDHLAHFDHERIPERVVHAKGAGAFGTFEVTSPQMAGLCKAKMFSRVGMRTPLAVRFSTVGGESGSPDTVRDPRGFAIKFYSEEGNWDLVGNNTPIFFIRDPIFFPSFIHTQKRNPQTHLKDPDMFWDFISLRPETTHQVSFLFSDRGIPDGYRHMNGYGSHTYKLVNERGEHHFVKFHFKTDQGIRSLYQSEADDIAMQDPDYAIRDLYNAIGEGDFPSWTMYVQVMTEREADNWRFNPFDVTKVWPHREFPLVEVGRMTLNRNPQNYFAEVEQMAFCPSHMIPGVEPSPDKMLQARLFSYVDTHRHRLGTNYQMLPVNRPLNSIPHNYQRDGPSVTNNNLAGAPNYFPNSFNGPQPDTSARWHEEDVIENGKVARYDDGNDHNFEQVGDFYRNVLCDASKRRLVENIAGNMKNAQEFIRRRAIANFSCADQQFGAEIARKVDELLAQNPSSYPHLSRKPNNLNPPRSSQSSHVTKGTRPQSSNL